MLPALYFSPSKERGHWQKKCNKRGSASTFNNKEVWNEAYATAADTLLESAWGGKDGMLPFYEHVADK